MNPQDVPKPDPSNQPANPLQAPTAQLPQRPIPAPNTPIGPVQQPITPTDDQDAKLHGKGILTVIGTTAAYLGVFYMLMPAIGLGAIGRILGFLVWGAFIVGTFMHVSSLKKAGADTLQRSVKRNGIILMSINVLVGPAIYYFGLRGKLPLTASKLGKLGWKIFGLWLIGIVLPLFVLVFILAYAGVSVKSWEAKHGDQFFTTTQKLQTDITSASTAILKQDATGLKTACGQITQDVNNLKAVRKFPKEPVAQKISDAADTLASGAKDCSDGVDQQSQSLIAQAGKEISTGISQMDTAITSLRNELNESE